MCIFEDVKTKIQNAVKFDPKVGQTNVLTECHFLRDHKDQLLRCPQYKFHATVGGRRYLVMELLPLSIFEYV